MLHTPGYLLDIDLVPPCVPAYTTKHIKCSGSDITIASLQRKTNVVALTRSAATLLHDSYQEIDAENVETEKLVGNAARAVKDNIHTLDQLFDIYPSPEDGSIDKPCYNVNSFTPVLHITLAFICRALHSPDIALSSLGFSAIHIHLWGAMAYRLEGQTLNRENPVSNPTAVASNLWQV